MNPLIALGIGIGFVTWSLKKLVSEGEQKENLTRDEKPTIKETTQAIDVPSSETDEIEKPDSDDSSTSADNLDAV